MFALRSLGFRLFSSDRAGSAGQLRAVAVHNIEENPDKRSRALKHLIKANHINHSIIYNHDRFHNHAPHILGCAYILGGDSEHLHHVYDIEDKSLEPWKDSPGDISQEDWRDFLGKREYQRAYIDFFEEQLVRHGHDWRELLEVYLFSEPAPLVNGLVGGLAHGLIHLGYAYELSSKTLAIESLGLTTCFYDSLHRYLDDPGYTRPSKDPSTDLLVLLARAEKDARLDSASAHRDSEELDVLWSDSTREEALLEHWNAWELTDPVKQLAEAQRTAVALLVASESGRKAHFDFFLVHVLTSSHAVRILLPLFPEKWHVSLVRQWWLLALTAYVKQGRPAIASGYIDDYDLQGRGWDFVTSKALSSKWATDAHFVKACRAFKVAAETWGDESQYFLKAGVRFADEFADWSF